MDKATIQFLIDKYENRIKEKQEKYEFYRDKPNNRKDYTMSIKTVTCDKLYYSIQVLQDVVTELKTMLVSEK